MNKTPIQIKTISNHTIITLSGTIDFINAELLDQEIQRAFDQNIYDIIIDLEQVKLITSVGIRVLLKAMRECLKYKGSLKLAHASESIQDILKIIGIKFDLYDSISDALYS
jgi:anti-anti-sigma factor